MKMIPATPHGTHSKAEKRVFDRLYAAFVNEWNDSLVAYHSLNLTRHAYKRFGEIDFLISGIPGIFVLEVKGGRIACREGIWQFTNRYGEVFESVEGPFKQAESALLGLMANIRANLTERVVSQFTIGYGIVFPDCEWGVVGAEWNSHILADARGFRDFEQWLRNLFRYWRNKDGHNRQPDEDALKVLHKYLRPEFEAVVPLYVQSGQVEERVIALTEDQMAMVDVVTANPRVLCSGGAGTGKTFLAMEVARRFTAEGMKVALTCRSPWLKHYLEAQFSISGLTVTLAESIKIACRRAGLDRFDALIVDEGQDLFDMESLDSLDSSLNNGLSDGRWCFFYDANNQAGLFGKHDEEALDYLLSIHPVRVPLRTNCRNTRIILEKVQISLGADMGVRGAGEGPKIREHIVTTREASAERLSREIREIVDEGGVVPGNLSILSPFPFDESCASLLKESLKREIAILDEFSLRNIPLNKINFAQISNFKGLENEAVIVVDLEPPIKGKGSLTMHYVAMSRARAVLSLIFIKKSHRED
ncbi:MAG: Nuclease-related domain protein [Deltaproteobacteria bacterium ADurb.Bin026]|jgi:hypothetical protein|nr:MAG: Nuclease-related domain protein [Deltaproteobacteria bacterium ADurb.Bin026]